MNFPLPQQRKQSRILRGTGGTTILELAVVLVIIAIIASLLSPLYGAWISRSEEARCLANLRNLYIAASGHLNSAGSWPQVPMQMMSVNPHQFAREWVNALESFGAPHSSWICPTLNRNMGTSLEAGEKDENYRIDFVPSTFDDDPTTPRRAGGYPWFVEKAASHSRGQLVIFADGSTASLKDLIGGR